MTKTKQIFLRNKYSTKTTKELFLGIKIDEYLPYILEKLHLSKNDNMWLIKDTNGLQSGIIGQDYWLIKGFYEDGTPIVNILKKESLEYHNLIVCDDCGNIKGLLSDYDLK